MRALLDLLQENEAAVKDMHWQVSRLLSNAMTTLKILGSKSKFGEGRLNLLVAVGGKLRELSGSVDVKVDEFLQSVQGADLENIDWLGMLRSGEVQQMVAQMRR